MMMNDPDKLSEQLSAYVDGELDDKERAAVQELLRADAAARSELERLRETAALVRGMPHAVAPATTTRDVMRAIERGDLLGDAPTQATAGAWRRYRSLLLTAATIGLTVGVGLWGLSLNVRTEEPRQLAQIAKPLQSPPIDAANERVGRVSPAAPRRKAGETRPTAAMAKTVPERRHDVLAVTAATEDDDARTVAMAEVLPERRRNESLQTAAAVDAYRAPPPSEFDLEIICADARDLAWCRERLDRFIGEQDRRSADAVGYAMETVFQFDDAGQVSSAMRTDGTERRISLPAARLRQLVAVFDAGPSAQREVKLSAGALLRATGWSQTQQLLAFVQEKPADGLAAKSHGMRVSGKTQTSLPRRQRSIARNRADADGSLALPSLGFTQATSPVDTPAVERLVTVTIRLRVPARLPKPDGEPGRLVPTLTEDPK